MNLLLKLNDDRKTRALKLAANQPHTMGLYFHGAKVNVATNSVDIVEHIRLGYSFFETAPNEKTNLTLLIITEGQKGFESAFDFLLPDREKRENIVIMIEGDLIFLTEGKDLTAYYTTMNLFRGVMDFLRPKFVCLHAATVSHQGFAVIICGAARCGKTSITTNLISQGFSYSSDDVTLIDRRSFAVLSFPRSLNVREEYLKLQPDFLARARHIGHFKIADQNRLIVNLGIPVPDSVTPKTLCFPKYNPGKSSTLSRLNKIEAFAGLMQNRFHPMYQQTEVGIGVEFDSICHLTESCDCYLLEYSDVEEASLLIAGFLNKFGEGNANNISQC